MSLFRRSVVSLPMPVSPRADRTGHRSAPSPTAASAMRQSVVWAAVHRKASLISSMPVDVFRKVGGVAIETNKPRVLVQPWSYADGQPETIADFLYSSQVSLEQYGNAVGVIHGRDGAGLPSQIELVDMTQVRFTVRRRRIVEYRIHGEVTSPRDVWHERMYGAPVGLSPIAHAATTLYSAEAALQFAAEWFGGDAVPSGVLRNTEKGVPGDAADVMKQRYRAAMMNGDLFVTGKDWEYNPVTAKALESSWIDQMEVAAADLCRFFGVPASEVDVPVKSTTVNYANIQQANLQLLVKHLGPAVDRREDALSRLTPAPRFVKLNRSALLAMDDEMRAKVNETRIRSRELTPSEAREKNNMAPLTPEQIEEFHALFGNPSRQITQGAQT